MNKTREQELVDALFQVAFAVRDSDVLKNMDNEELADWVADKLRKCGFDTYPCGSSWGVLREKDNV